MKKLIFTFAVLIGLLNTTFGQDRTELNVGIGLLPTVVSNTSAGLPPLTVSYEKYIKENISVGAYAGFSTSKAEDLGAFFGGSEYSVKYTALIFGARGAYHFEVENDRIDPYVGAMLGYNIVNSKVKGSSSPVGEAFDATGSGFGYAAFVGAKYQATDNLKLFGEVGYGISVLSFGVTLNL